MGYWVKTAFQGVASAAARRSLDLSVLLVTDYFILLFYFPGNMCGLLGKDCVPGCS